MCPISRSFLIHFLKIDSNWKKKRHVETILANIRCCCNEQFNKILIFFPALHPRNQQSCFPKTLSCNTPAKLDAILHVQSACACHKCACGFHTAYTWQSFLVKNLLISRMCGEKKVKILPSCWRRFVIATSPIEKPWLHNK